MQRHVKILILEGQTAIADLLHGELGKEGFQYQIQKAASGMEFGLQIAAFAPDLIVARHSPPDCDGLAALATARVKCGHVPIIVVCGATETDIALQALQQGATDYILEGEFERLGFAARRALRELQQRSESNKAWVALQEMEERYRALFDRSHDCLFVHDFEGNFIDANPAGLALLGYAREEIPSVSLQSVICEEHLPLALECMEEVMRTGTLKHSKEFNLKHKNGARLTVEVKASLVLRAGKPHAIQGIGRDITDRKRAEAELLRMNRLYTVLSYVNQTLIRARTPEELLQQVCSITVEHGGFQSVRISRPDLETRRVIRVASAGGLDELVDMVPVYADDRLEGRGPTGTAIREGKVCICNDVQTDPRTLPWRQSTEIAGIRAAASFPIRFCGNIFGALSLYDGERNAFQEKEVALLRGVAEAVSSGLDRLEQEAQRKRAEESLTEGQEAVRQSDARFRRLVQETGQVIFDYDLSSGRIDWEGAASEVLGYSREEMRAIGVGEWEALVHPEERAQTVAQLNNAIASGRRYRVEYRFQRKDGAYISVDEHGSFLRDDTGRVVRMFGTMSDITERKNIEDRNLEQARLLYMAHDAILARNLDDTIVYWNESAERLYGWSAEEALGCNVETLLQEPPSKAAEFKRAVLQHDEWNDELVHTTKCGDQVRVETRMTLVRDRQGKPKSILSINRDITARKKLEAQLLRSQRMESIGTLASGIAHDLNNVLAPILMSCQLLSGDDAGGERKQWIEIINRSAQRGADLVRQVLTFCRGTEGRRTELHVKNLIGEMNHIARQTFPKSVKLQTRISKDLWTIVADPTQLHQVLLNLCVNARDAMPNGGVLTIAAENVLLDIPQPNATRDTKPRPHLMISVADTGSGIPPEIWERIFDPFFTTKELGKGTGLGLSTSLGIVKSHGGFINIYSEPGVGTVFKVYIPAMAAAAKAHAQPTEDQLPRGNGELVLLVDDEAAVRTITSQILQTYGYHVMTACNGAEALELYGRHSGEVAVILMDTMMPVMDGRTTINTLARRSPDLKVISASGLFPEASMTETPSDLVKAYLPKPFTTEALLKTIRDVLNGKIANTSADASQTQTHELPVLI